MKDEDLKMNNEDFEIKWKQLKDAIREYGLFNDVCEFVADKIIEGRA